MLEASVITSSDLERSVSSAIVQRYLPHVLAAALSVKAQARNAALEVISFTIKQGLAHPIQVQLLRLFVIHGRILKPT